MHTYEVFYKGKRNTLVAETSYKAQQLAAQLWRVKKSYEIIVMLVDTPINTSSI